MKGMKGRARHGAEGEFIYDHVAGGRGGVVRAGGCFRILPLVSATKIKEPLANTIKTKGFQ